MSTFTWLAGATGDWSSVSNWAGQVVPGPGDTAILQPGSGVATITIANPVTLGSILETAGTAGATGSLFLALDSTLALSGSLALTGSQAAFGMEGGASLVAQGVTIGNGAQLDAFGTQVVAGGDRTLTANVVNNGIIQVSGQIADQTLIVNGSISGAGSIIVALSTLEVNGPTNQTITLDGLQSLLRLDQPGNFSGEVVIDDTQYSSTLAADGYGNNVGNVIDLPGITASAVTVSGATLTVHESNGSTLPLRVILDPPSTPASIATDPRGYFPIVSNDGSGGTMISYVTPTWATAASGVWSNAANWVNGVVPIAGNDALIPGTGDYYGVTISVTAPVTVGYLTFDAGAATIANSSTITLNDGLELYYNTLNGGVLAGSGALLTATTGTLSAVTLQGTLQVDVASNLQIDNGISFAGLGGAGAAVLNLDNPGGFIDLSDPATTLANVTINFGSGTLSGWQNDFINFGGTGPNGSLTLAANTTLNLAGSYAEIDPNYGVDTGNANADLVVNNGTINAGFTGGQLNFDYLSSFRNNGLIQIGNGGTNASVYLGADSFINTGSISVTNGGILDIGNSSTSGFSNTGTITANGAELILDSVTGTGTIALNDSTLVVVGTVNLASNNHVGLTDSLVDNEGLLIASGTVGYMLENEQFATLEASGGVLTVGTNVTGSGNFLVAASTASELEFSSNPGAGGTVGFSGAAGTLKLDAPAGFSRMLGSLFAGDTIDLAGVSAASAAISGGTLSVMESGGGVLHYYFQNTPPIGAVAVSTDGANGTDLTFQAATAWNSGTSGTWQTAANWNPGTVPAVTGTAVIDAGGNYTIAVPGSVGIGNLLIDAPGATVLAEGTLTVSNAITLASGALGMSGNGAIAGGRLVMDGGTLAGGGTLSSVTVQGSLALQGGGINVANGLTLLNAAGTAPGTLDVVGAELNFAGNATLDNATVLLGTSAGLSYPIIDEGDPKSAGAVLTFGPDLDLVQTGTSGVIYGPGVNGSAGIAGDGITNLGTMQIAGAGRSLLIQALAFSNAGTILVANGGVLAIDAGFTNSGTVSVSAATLAVDDGVSNTGSIAITNGTLLLGSIDVAQLNSDFVLNNATVEVTGVLQGAGTIAPMVVNEGTIEASGGLLTVGSNVTGGSDFAVAAGATLELQTASVGRVVTLDGGGATLKIDNLNGFAYSLAMAAGSTLDLPGIQAGSAYVSGSLLDVELPGDYALAAQFVVGSVPGNTVFAVAPDGSGGSLISMLGVDNWQRSASADWSTAADWSSGVAGIGSAATIAAGGNYTVGVSGSEAAGALTLSAAGAELAINPDGFTSTAAWGTLSVGGELTVDAGTLALINNGTLVGGTLVDAGGTILAEGGTLDHVTIKGAATLVSNGSSDVYVDILNGLSSAPANGVMATLLLHGLTSLAFDNSSTLNNSIIVLDGYGTSIEQLSGGTLTLGANQTVLQTGSIGNLQFGTGAGLINEGTIVVAGTTGGTTSSLQVVGGTIVNEGTISVLADDMLNLASSSFANQATILLQGGALFANTAGFSNAGLIQASGAAVITSTPGTTIANSGTIEIQSGADADITATVTGSGVLLLDAGSTLEVSNYATTSTLGAGQTVTFAGVGATLKLDNPARFSGTLAGMRGTDMLDLSGEIVSSASIVGSSLVVNSGTNAPQSFALANVPAGMTVSVSGSDITFVAAGPGPSVTLTPSPSVGPDGDELLGTVTPGGDPLAISLTQDTAFPTGSQVEIVSGQIYYFPGTITPALYNTTDTIGLRITDLDTGAVANDSVRLAITNVVTLQASGQEVVAQPGLAYLGSVNNQFDVTRNTIGDTITGGSGSNLLNVTGGGTLTMGGNISNVQVVSLGADGPYTFTANNQTGLEIVSRGADTIHDGNGGDTVVLFGQNGTVVGGSGNDTFYVSAALLAGTRITGGSGRNSLAVSDGSGSAVMGSGITGIAEVHLTGGTPGSAGYNFTANNEAGLVIVGSQGNDTITAGAASQTVYTFGNAATVIATAATAGALVDAVSGATTLQIAGGGNAVLNDLDSHGLTVELDQATDLQLGASGFITAIGLASGNTIVAQQVEETLGGDAGGDTLVGYAGFGDTFAGSTAGLLHDTIADFGGDDTIDVSGLTAASTSLSYTAGSGSGLLTLTDGSASTSMTLSGSYNPALFHLASDGNGGILVSYGNYFVGAGVSGRTISGKSGGGDVTVIGGGSVTMGASLTDATSVHLMNWFGAGAYDFTANSTPGLIILTSPNADVIHDGSGGDTVIVDSPDATIYGGGGNDTFYVTEATIGATIDGGTGSSNLAVEGGGTEVMGGNITRIAEVHLMGGTPGTAGFTFTANTEAGLVIVGSQGNDTITVGAASQTVYTYGQNSTVLTTAATAGAHVRAVSGHVTLTIAGGGTAALNNADSYGMAVQLDAATNLQLGKAAFTTVTGLAAGNTIVAQQIRQTLGGVAGSDTLVGYAGFGDTFAGSSTGLLGDLIENFGGNDAIDLTDLVPGSAVLNYTQGSGSGVLSVSDGTHNTSMTLSGSFNAALFQLSADGNGGSLIRYT